LNGTARRPGARFARYTSAFSSSARAMAWWPAREHEVLALIAEGRSNAAIARHLVISDPNGRDR
jgi:DNA-binding NarL/FixJ family response regulator